MPGFMDGFKKDIQDKLDWRKVEVIGGDLHPCHWDFNGGMMTPDPSTGLAECVNLVGEIKSLKIQTEEQVKDLQKTLGTTIAGGVVGAALGGIMAPVGLVAGYMAGAKRQLVCVLVELNDGKKFLANMDKRIYQQMVAFSQM